jgi:predicted nicotinamide N-methyase
MDRIVLPELLDVLPPEASPALRSRRDLRRLNAWMGHPRMMARALHAHWPKVAAGAPELAELGAGDGHFLLAVAKRLAGRWSAANVVLVDRLKVVDPGVAAACQRFGWSVRTEIAGAAEWLRRVSSGGPPVIVSNLFFHQFEADQLREMFDLMARDARLVIALEPRRAWLPQLAGRLLWAIGCGPVTRHDARVSIRAGFAGHELSTLWPDRANWTLTERPAGLFSHLFIAERKGNGPGTPLCD